MAAKPTGVIAQWNRVRLAISDLIEDEIAPSTIQDLSELAPTPAAFVAGAVASMEFADIVRDHNARKVSQ